jgi:glycosyltransferase involved in cell wall biosynthesis
MNAVVILVNVAMVAPQPPWYPGGVEKHVGEITRGLKENVKLEIYCTSDKPGDIKNTIWENVSVHVHKGSGYGHYYSKSLKAALRNVTDYDIIHAHGFTTYIPKAASLAKPKKSFIFTPHYHPVGSSTMYRFARVFYDPVIGKSILNKADKIICVSKTEKDRLAQTFPGVDKKISIIPNGVNISLIGKAKPYEQVGHTLLYAGRLERYKNIDKAILAMKDLPADYNFNVIGIGPDKIRLENLAKELELTDRVRFLGHISESELHRHFKTADLFITLSDIEAFGITVIEALCAKKPVVVNDAMSLSEFALQYPEAVTAVDIHNYDTAKLTALIRKKVERSPEVKDLTIDVSRYDWANICDSILKVYEG